MRPLRQGVLVAMGIVLATGLLATRVQAENGEGGESSGDTGDAADTGPTGETDVQAPGDGPIFFDPPIFDPPVDPPPPVIRTTPHVVDHLPYEDTWEGTAPDRNVSFPALGVSEATGAPLFSHQGTAYTTIPATADHEWVE